MKTITNPLPAFFSFFSLLVGRRSFVGCDFRDDAYTIAYLEKEGASLFLRGSSTRTSPFDVEPKKCSFSGVTLPIHARESIRQEIPITTDHSIIQRLEPNDLIEVYLHGAGKSATISGNKKVYAGKSRFDNTSVLGVVADMSIAKKHLAFARESVPFDFDIVVDPGAAWLSLATMTKRTLPDILLDMNGLPHNMYIFGGSKRVADSVAYALPKDLSIESLSTAILTTLRPLSDKNKQTIGITGRLADQELVDHLRLLLSEIHADVNWLWGKQQPNWLLAAGVATVLLESGERQFSLIAEKK